MPKIRVYELARELNLTNKNLITKLDEIGIFVKSHMSPLTGESVARIKEVILGEKDDPALKRNVEPAILRRRKKKKDKYRGDTNRKTQS